MFTFAIWQAEYIDANLSEETDFENFWIFSIAYALYPDLADDQQQDR